MWNNLNQKVFVQSAMWNEKDGIDAAKFLIIKLLLKSYNRQQSKEVSYKKYLNPKSWMAVDYVRSCKVSIYDNIGLRLRLTSCSHEFKIVFLCIWMIFNSSIGILSYLFENRPFLTWISSTPLIVTLRLTSVKSAICSFLIQFWA